LRSTFLCGILTEVGKHNFSIKTMPKFVQKTLMEQLPRTEKGLSGPNSLYEEFRQLLYDIVKKQRPMTVRQVFYRAVVKGYVEKVEEPGGYKLVQPDLAKMRRETAKLGMEFHIIAVTPQQIEEMNLPTRPTKTSDKRAKKFGSDESVELDAIEPNVLRQMVDETLQGCFPPGAIESLKQQQREAREEIRRRLQELLRDDGSRA
jgi:hypothetical protein